MRSGHRPAEVVLWMTPFRETAMTDRRSFLATLAALPVMTTLDLGTPVTPTPVAADWDLSWLDSLTGKHKQVFDVQEFEIPLIVVSNYLRAFREVMKLEYPDVNTVVGLGEGYPINATDRIWEQYRLGEKWKIKDPDTGTWATRNVYALRDPMPKGVSPEHTVQGLQKRGTIFWQCNNALNFISGTFATELKRPFEEVRKELLDGMLPGVKLVPAHTMLIGLTQEHGCTYERL
jgi:hypothetical protein